MTIKEEKRDLFTMSDDYALVHCISADFKLGAGIAKEFDKRFNCREMLFQKHGDSFISDWDSHETGLDLRGFVITTADMNNGRSIYNLITKRNYWDKPTLETLEGALKWMKCGCVRNKDKKIAMPRIGCGFDGQKWSDVKRIIEEVFCDTDIEIVVCVK